jgi:ABC-type branched-subunit amino acid transport system permease subunit
LRSVLSCWAWPALWALRISARSNRTASLNLSFQILFIIIIGGMGSIGGNFLGAAFVVLLPILLSNAGSELARIGIGSDQLQNLQKIVFGSLVIVFLIKEPDGLARLVQVARQRFRPRNESVSTGNDVFIII